MKKIFRFIAIIGLASSLLIGSLSADTDSSHHYTGHMSDNTPEFVVTLKLYAGEVIVADAVATSDDLDPYLLLKDSNGDTLIENDDADFDVLDARLVYYVRETGTYEVVVANIIETSGDYELTIDVLKGGEIIDDLESDRVTLGSDEETTYELGLEAGKSILIETVILDGNLDTMLFLIDPSGDLVAWNDDLKSDDFSSYLIHPLSETGTYEVIVKAWDNTDGDYQLNIQILDEAFGIRSNTDTNHNQDFVKGVFDGEFDVVTYTVDLEAWAGLIIHGQSQQGVLDMIVRVLDEDGNILADSDQWSAYWHSVDAYFVAEETGTYYIEVSAENDTQGDYKLTFQYADAEAVIAKLRTTLSGEHQTLETDHFIIHYTYDGIDAISDEQAYFIADVIENIYDVQINEMGWYPPVKDGWRGGDDRYDIYIQNVLETDGNYGYAVPEYPITDNPHSPLIEDSARGGYLIVSGHPEGDPKEIQQALIATLAHEFHHLVQYGYNAIDIDPWYYESMAVYMEVVTMPPYNEALMYVPDVLTYPEICLGAIGEADPTGGLLQYGHWLFIQSLIDLYGDELLQDFWENIALYGQGWEIWEMTLADYDVTIPEVVARYHLQNLALDYELAPLFEDQDRVWVDGYIDETGVWEMAARGVQELGVNYYLINLDAGIYQFSLDDAPDYLELYAVGIDTDSGMADVFNLGTMGGVDVSAYDEFVLMVFNNSYHDELDNCSYESYSIGVKAGGDALPVSDVINATHYRSLYE